VPSSEAIGGRSDASPPPRAVSKACHPALDAGTLEKTILIIMGLRVIHFGATVKTLVEPTDIPPLI